MPDAVNWQDEVTLEKSLGMSGRGFELNNGIHLSLLTTGVK